MKRPIPSSRRKSAPKPSGDSLWLTEALKIFKTQAAFAQALGVEPGAVTNWKRRGVPVEQCPAIARVTNNRVPAHKVRPDFFQGIAA